MHIRASPIIYREKTSVHICSLVPILIDLNRYRIIFNKL